MDLVAGLDLDLSLKIIGEGESKCRRENFMPSIFAAKKMTGLSYRRRFWFVRGVGSIKETVTQRSTSGDLLSRNSIELLKLPALHRPTGRGKKGTLETSVSTSGDGDPLNVISADACKSWHVGVVMACEKMQGPGGLDCAGYRDRAR